jgi:hypothetical protein
MTGAILGPQTLTIPVVFATTKEFSNIKKMKWPEQVIPYATYQVVASRVCRKFQHSLARSVPATRFNPFDIQPKTSGRTICRNHYANKLQFYTRPKTASPQDRS